MRFSKLPSIAAYAFMGGLAFSSAGLADGTDGPAAQTVDLLYLDSATAEASLAFFASRELMTNTIRAVQAISVSEGEQFADPYQIDIANLNILVLDANGYDVTELQARLEAEIARFRDQEAS
ncbi:MAG: hypothetical protein AAGA70_13415 [Pseudomonadota bacterium]